MCWNWTWWMFTGPPKWPYNSTTKKSTTATTTTTATTATTSWKTRMKRNYSNGFKLKRRLEASGKNSLRFFEVLGDFRVGCWMTFEMDWGEFHSSERLNISWIMINGGVQSGRNHRNYRNCRVGGRRMAIDRRWMTDRFDEDGRRLFRWHQFRCGWSSALRLNSWNITDRIIQFNQNVYEKVARKFFNKVLFSNHLINAAVVSKCHRWDEQRVRF